MKALEWIGSAFLKFFTDVGAFISFYFKIWKMTFQTSGNFQAIVDQVAHVSFRSLVTVLFSGIFVGAILVVQFNVMLREYGAQSLLGGLTTSSVVREVGPLIISFLIAGKIGAYTAAELGTMRVTDQIDAIECLGADSLQQLVLPRFVAIILSSVILLIFGMIISIVGAVGVSSVVAGVNPLQFLESIPKFTNLWTLFCGVTKSLVYSSIVASIACYKGYFASGGAQGVGMAVTQTAIYINFYIILTNYAVSQILEGLASLIETSFGVVL